MNPSGNSATGAGKGSLRSYILGFCLSILLTAIAFGLVMQGRQWPRPIVVSAIVTAAVLQILAHLRYFLHLDSSSDARWNVMALLFTAAIMFLFVGGSLWIMFNLHGRMM